MGTVVNTNTMALTSYRNLSTVSRSQGKASARLSSGKKINNAADDAAGLAISEKMTSQIRGLDMAYKNSQDAISMLQTTEGAVSEINNMVQRIRELAVQASNDTNTTEDRSKLQEEVTQLQNEINDMAGRSEFNELKLTEKDATRTFHIGANNGQVISFKFEGVKASNLSGLNNASVSTRAKAEEAISTCSKALKKITTYRAKIGATENRLEYTANNLQVTSENLSAARSRVEDADMAKEMMNMTQNNVLTQAATSMLAQSNASTQNVLQLLG
ncbi:MAG: flagellin [Firmicutes bacterium]|nr:flagellin [Bacillota bacterium]